MAKNPRVFLISGPSGVGKSSIIQKLMEQSPDLQLSVSCTTRRARPGEQDGTHYRFLSKDEFEKERLAGAFLEFAEVYGNFYGTHQQHVLDILTQGHHAVLDVDSQGAMAIKEKCDGVVYIFIAPPSLAHLRERLTARGTETPENLERRLSFAKHEMSHANIYDYLVENNQLDLAIQTIAGMIETEAGKPVAFKVRQSTAMAETQTNKDSSTELKDKIQAKVIQQLTTQMGDRMEHELLELLQDKLHHVIETQLEDIIKEAVYTFREKKS